MRKFVVVYYLLSKLKRLVLKLLFLCSFQLSKWLFIDLRKLLCWVMTKFDFQCRCSANDVFCVANCQKVTWLSIIYEDSVFVRIYTLSVFYHINFDLIYRKIYDSDQFNFNLCKYLKNWFFNKMIYKEKLLVFEWRILKTKNFRFGARVFWFFDNSEYLPINTEKNWKQNWIWKIIPLYQNWICLFRAVNTKIDFFVKFHYTRTILKLKLSI